MQLRPHTSQACWPALSCCGSSGRPQLPSGRLHWCRPPAAARCAPRSRAAGPLAQSCRRGRVWEQPGVKEHTSQGRSGTPCNRTLAGGFKPSAYYPTFSMQTDCPAHPPIYGLLVRVVHQQIQHANEAVGELNGRAVDTVNDLQSQAGCAQQPAKPSCALSSRGCAPGLRACPCSPAAHGECMVQEPSPPRSNCPVLSSPGSPGARGPSAEPLPCSRPAGA